VENMPPQETSSAITSIVGSEITAVEQKMNSLLERGAQRSQELEEEQERENQAIRDATGEDVLNSPVPAWVLTDEEQKTFDSLRTRIQRLNQVQSFFRDDPELMQMVDSAIAKRTQAAQRRQTGITIGVALISLPAGWLLSAVSPVAAVTQLLGGK
jgi:hypothetical protein